MSVTFLRKFSVLILASAIAVWASPAFAAEGDAAAPKTTDAKKPDAGGAEGGDAKKKGPEDVSGGRFEGDPVYVHLAPMVLPIITDDGAEQLVTLIIDVEVKDFNVADAMHTNMPKVRDALMRALYGGLGKGNLRKGKMIDVSRIKAKATTALSEIMGDGIREVLVQGVAQRML